MLSAPFSKPWPNIRPNGGSLKQVFEVWLCLILLPIYLGGCAASAPSRFYLLHSLPDAGAQERAGSPVRSIAIGVGPVQLPDYLDRPQIVTRTTLNELQLGEFDKWAEPLEKNFTRVVAENLSVLLATDRVAVFPWSKSMEIAYQIAMDVTQFEGMPGGEIALSVRWTIYGGEGKRLIMMRQSKFSEPLGTSGYAALVAAQSRAIAALCREISIALNSLPPGAPQQ